MSMKVRDDLVEVHIRWVDGVAIRAEVVFETGTLLPGETLKVPKFQADMAIEQGVCLPGAAEPVEPPAAPVSVAKKAGRRRGKPLAT